VSLALLHSLALAVAATVASVNAIAIVVVRQSISVAVEIPSPPGNVNALWLSFVIVAGAVIGQTCGLVFTVGSECTAARVKPLSEFVGAEIETRVGFIRAQELADGLQLVANWDGRFPDGVSIVPVRAI